MPRMRCTIATTWRRRARPRSRRRACRAPLASAGSTAPKPPRKHRAQHQHAAHQAAECCTGVQRTLRRCGVASPPCPRSRRAAARPSTSCRKCAPPSGSTGCSLRIRSFAQRSVRATPRKADPQSAREAVCGRPGKRALASSAAMPSARASEQRERGHNHFWNPGPVFFFSCLTWRFESRHSTHWPVCSLPARLGDLSPTSARRPRAHHQRAATAHTAPAGSPPSSPPVGAVRRHVRRNGDRTARAGVENVINRRASAPRRRSAGEVLGHPRAAVRAAADLCAARILFVIRACAV